MTRRTRCDGEGIPPLTIQVPEDIAQMVEHLSAAAGTAPEQLVLSALRKRFAPIRPDLMRQFEAWERVSEFDCARGATFKGDI